MKQNEKLFPFPYSIEMTSASKHQEIFCLHSAWKQNREKKKEKFAFNPWALKSTSCDCSQREGESEREKITIFACVLATNV
jgi:hypothetical protein